MSEMLLSIIVCLVLWALINWIRSTGQTSKGKTSKGQASTGQTSAQAAPQREADYARTRTLFEMGKNRLVYLGLGDLMMSDYQFRTKVGSLKTTDLKTLQQQLQDVLMEILSHLHMMPDVRLIVTRDPKDLYNVGALGEYHHNYQDKQIRLLVDPRFTTETVVSALCHESAHYFAYTKGVRHLDRDLDEGLTDTLTILLGFSDAVLKGDHSNELPALNQQEFLELRRLLAEYRKEQKDGQAAALELETARKQLGKNIAGARGMLTQVQAMIAVKKTPAGRKRFSQKDMDTFQKTLLALESGAFEDTLARAEKVSGGDLRTVKAADAEVLDVCAKLYRLMLAFQ